MAKSVEETIKAGGYKSEGSGPVEVIGGTEDATAVSESVLLNTEEMKLYARLEQKHGFPAPLNQKILRATKFLLPKGHEGAEDLAAQSSDFQEDLGAFLNHPVVLRQALTLLNLKVLKTGMIAPGAEDALGKLKKTEESDARFSMQQLLKVLQEGTKELPKAEQEALKTNRDRMKYVNENLKRLHVPDDLNRADYDVFGWFRNDVGISFLKSQLSSISTKVAESVVASDLPSYQKKYIVEYILRLIQVPESDLTRTDPNRMTQFRNTLWAFHTYGLCTVDYREVKKGGAAKDTANTTLTPNALYEQFVPQATIEINPNAGALFVEHVKIFFSSNDPKGFLGLSSELSEGLKVVDPSTGNAIVPRISAPQNLVASLRSKIRKTNEHVPRADAAVDVLTRKLRGERKPRTVKKAKPSSVSEAPVVVAPVLQETTEEVVPESVEKWAGVPTTALRNDSFVHMLETLKLKKHQHENVLARLSKYRNHVAAFSEIPETGKFNIEAERQTLSPLIERKETLAINAGNDHAKLKEFVDKTRTIIREVKAQHAALPGQIAQGRGDEYSRMLGVFNRAYNELIPLISDAENVVTQAEQAMKSLERQHPDLFNRERKEARETRAVLISGDPVIAVFKDEERKLLRISVPEGMAEKERSGRIRMFMDVRDHFYRKIAGQFEEIPEPVVKAIELIFQTNIAKPILDADAALFVNTDSVSKAKRQLLRATLIERINTSIDIFLGKENSN